MKHFVSIVLLTALSVSAMQALPRYALTTGAKCAACHVNPTGGQLRTEFGTSYSSNTLVMATTHKKGSETTETATDSTAEVTPAEEDFTFNPRLTENITIGGDLRTQLIHDRASKTTTFQAMTMSLYGAVQVNKKVTLYFKQDIINSSYGFLSGPEAYGLIKPSSSCYVKGGIFMPDYGLRMDDHTAYARGGDLGFIGSIGNTHRGLIFIPNYKDIGVEGGWNHGGLLLTGGVFNGSGNVKVIDFSKQKAFAAKGEYMGNASEDLHYRFGASAYGYSEFHMYGAHAGVGAENFALYGELDWTRNMVDDFTGGIISGVQCMASFAELDYRVKPGAWITGRFETFDPQLGLENDTNGSLLNGVQRVVIGAELFPYSFVEIRPQYRLNLENPSVDNDQILLQLHYWY